MEILKTQLVWNILFIYFYYIKILHILCVAYHKFNGMHHSFIMKVKEVLDRFFHVYVMKMTMNTCVITFLAYFTFLSPHVDLFMMYTNPMTNYQCEHFQIFYDVVKNTSTTIDQNWVTNFNNNF